MSQKQTSRCSDTTRNDAGRAATHDDDVRVAHAICAPLRVAHAAHGDGRGRLRVGVVRMRDGARGRHHHRIRYRVLHCSKITVSHHGLSCGHRVIGDGRTLRALVVVVGVGVGRDGSRRH